MCLSQNSQWKIGIDMISLSGRITVLTHWHGDLHSTVTQLKTSDQMHLTSGFLNYFPKPLVTFSLRFVTFALNFHFSFNPEIGKVKRQTS